MLRIWVALLRLVNCLDSIHPNDKKSGPPNTQSKDLLMPLLDRPPLHVSVLSCVQCGTRGKQDDVSPVFRWVSPVNQRVYMQGCWWWRARVSRCVALTQVVAGCTLQYKNTSVLTSWVCIKATLQSPAFDLRPIPFILSSSQHTGHTPCKYILCNHLYARLTIHVY